MTIGVLAAGAPAGAGEQQPWGPWSASPDSPVILTSAERSARAKVTAPQEAGIAATPFLWLLKLHQRHLTKVDGDRCPMYPTCSQYSVQAIREHGPVIGIVMTADRLLHEAEEQRLAPAVKIGNRYRFLDPVENNDFWWYQR